MVSSAKELRRSLSIVDRSKFFILFNTENDRSAEQFAIGIVKNKRYTT